MVLLLDVSLSGDDEVWPQFRSPLEWDIWAVLTYLTVSVVFWYIGLVPDLAAAAIAHAGGAGRCSSACCRSAGAARRMHWMRWNQAYRLLAALAVPLVVSVHSEVSLLFAAGTIPGWHSTIFPPYFVLGAAFSGFAVVAMIAVALRTLFGLDNLVTDDHLDILGKVLLATGLMTAYGYVFEVFDALYSGDAHESQTLNDRPSAPIAWSYWGAIVFNFVAAAAAVVARGAALALGAVSVSPRVAVGMWLERYMILVTSLYHDFLVSSWGVYTPTFWDGDLCRHDRAVLVPFLLFVRLLPVISIFETKEVLHEEHEEAAPWPEPSSALLAEFETPEALVAAAKQARAQGYRSSMRSRHFRCRNFIACCGCATAACCGLALSGGTVRLCPRPGHAAVHQFQLSDRCRRPSALCAIGLRRDGVRTDSFVCRALAGLRHVALNGLPRLHHPVFSASQFARARKDRFFLCVLADDKQFDPRKTTQFLRALEPASVELVPS